MKPGTPGFSGDRLREGREARGLSAISLSDLIGVSRQAVSKYEKGLQTPSPEVMGKISQVLNLPLQFFLRGPRTNERNVLFWRCQTTATKGARMRAERLYDWLLDTVQFLKRYIKFPALNLPSLDLPDDPRAITVEMIEDSALRTRRFWGLGDGPISNVTWLMENNGIVMSRYDLGAEKLDAFSEWCPDDNTPYVVLGSDKGSAVRSRFDAAHELAHLLLHKSVKLRDFNKGDFYNLCEKQANRFAGAFLLPGKTFLTELLVPQLDSMRVLKSKWRVSIGLQIHRLSDLEVIGPDDSRRLWINRARRGWNTNEPLDNTIPPEMPRFLKRCFEMLLQKGIIARDQIPMQLHMPTEDIENLCVIPAGFLSDSDDDDNDPEILKFPFQRHA